MGSGRWAVPVIVLALLTTGCDLEPAAGPVRVDHTTAPTRAAEPEAADPAAGAFTEAWRADVKALGPSVRLQNLEIDYGVTLAYAAGQVLVFSSSGVAAYAAEDGKARWHYQELRNGLGAYAITGDTLVLSDPPETNEAPYTVALDVATGAERWRSREFDPVPHEGRMPSGRGIVVLEDTEEDSRYVGVDARTGARRWTWERQDDSLCVDLPRDSDGGLVLIEFSCGPYDEDQGSRKSTLYALDPGTGRPVWKRGAGWAVSRAGLTLLVADQGLELVRRDGRVLRRFGSDTGSASMTVTRGRAVVAYESTSGSTGRVMVSVDPRTGEASEPAPTAIPGEVAVAGGQVYGERNRLGRPVTSTGEPAEAPPYGGLLAAGVEIVDPRTLRTRRVPLMSADASGFWGKRRVLAGRTLLADGRLYNAVRVQNALRVTAYVPGDHGSPAELGGVPARDWPDACALQNLSKASLADPPWNLRLGSNTVAGWSCERPGLNRAKVWTAWTAKTARAADRLLDPPAGVTARPLRGVGDEAYRLDPPGALGDRVLLRVGRHIVVIETPVDPPSKKTAEAVARNLEHLPPRRASGTSTTASR